MKTKVTIVKGNNRKENINSALDLIKREVNDSIRKKGKETLFVKVNTLDPTIQAACTHPEALEAVLDYFYGDFQRVIVGDNSSCFMRGPNIYTHLKTKFEKLEFSDLKGFGSEELQFEMLHDMIKARIRYTGCLYHLPCPSKIARCFCLYWLLEKYGGMYY
jgi:hypothetical protein